MSHIEPVAPLTGTTHETARTGPVAASPGPAQRLFAIADLLACPECAQALTGQDRSLRCPDGHSFDLAKQGYVSLLTGASTKMTGDTPAMLDARAAFQQAGHFAPIAAALARAAASERTSDPAAGSSAAASPRPGRVRPGSTAAAASSARLASTLLPSAVVKPASPSVPAILEIGAGTGYYLAALLDGLPSARGIALDVAKPAARRCARAHPRAAAVLADAWHGLPVRDGVLGTVVSVFAPRNPDEVRRVLAADGRFLVVTPTTGHLGELIGPLGMVSVDAAKDDRLAESLGTRFELLDRIPVEYSMALTHADIAHVVGMGPSAFHASEDRAERIAALPEVVSVTASVTVSIFRPR